MPSKENMDPATADRYKYDDDEDEDEVPIYYVDPFDTESLLFRSRILPLPPSQAQIQARRAQMEAAAAAQAASQGNPSIRSSRQSGSDG